MPTPAQIGRARARLHGTATIIVALVMASYGLLVLAHVGLMLRFVGALGLVVGLVATATGIMHAANHSAFSRSRTVNRAAALTADLLGASSSVWRRTHNNVHHGNTNVVGVDPDIDQAPFGRLTPEQPWKRWHRDQHVYLWFLYGFLGLRWFLLGDFVELARRRGRPDRHTDRRAFPGEVAGALAGKLLHLGWAVLVPLVLRR
jgi:linoleoyl-CoA desaturase